MMITTLATLAFVTALAAPQQAANDLAVSVMLRTASASGQPRTTAGSDRGDEVIARVTTDANLCTLGSGDFALQRPHDYSWEITARVVSRAADMLTADVTWKQLEGPGAGNPQRAQTVVLKSGERVVLETIRPSGSPRCGTEATLEVEAGSRIRMRPGSTVGVGVGGGRSGGIGGGGAAGGLSAGARSGGSSGVGASAGGGAGAGSAVGVGAFELRDPIGVSASLPPGNPFSVEMWVVRTLPNGTERVEAHDRAENISAVAKKFGPVSVATPAGNVSVTIGVDLRTFARAKDPLSVLINRDEIFDGKPGHGGTSRVSGVPGETEIISLELPQSARYADRFSVRLKFTKPGPPQG